MEGCADANLTVDAAAAASAAVGVAADNVVAVAGVADGEADGVVDVAAADGCARFCSSASGPAASFVP